MVSERALDIARIIFEVEPEAAAGDPAAVERVTDALAKITGVILSTVLVRKGDEVFDASLRKFTQAIEREARSTASMAIALLEGSDPPGTLN